MLEAHGIENDTESPLNSSNKRKYPFHRFSHSLRLKDIFSIYDTELVRIKKEKGNAIRRVLGDGSNSTKTRIAHRIFIEGMKMICHGVVNREFIFKFPVKNMEVIFKIIKAKDTTAKALFKFHRGKVDPFEMNFEMYQAVLQVKYPKRPSANIRVALSQDMYYTIMDNVAKKKSYQNSKIHTIQNISDRLQESYPTLTNISILSILRHGLNTIFKAIIRKCDSYINLDTGDDAFFMYFCGSRDVHQFNKVRLKIRYLMTNTKGKAKHTGTYFFYLNDKLKEMYDSGENITVDCTKYIEELHAGKWFAKYIYKLEDPACKKQHFIDLINRDTKHITLYEKYIDNNFIRA